MQANAESIVLFIFGVLSLYVGARIFWKRYRVVIQGVRLQATVVGWQDIEVRTGVLIFRDTKLYQNIMTFCYNGEERQRPCATLTIYPKPRGQQVNAYYSCKYPDYLMRPSFGWWVCGLGMIAFGVYLIFESYLTLIL